MKTMRIGEVKKGVNVLLITVGDSVITNKYMGYVATQVTVIIHMH